MNHNWFHHSILVCLSTARWHYVAISDGFKSNFIYVSHFEIKPLWFWLWYYTIMKNDSATKKKGSFSTINSDMFCNLSQVPAQRLASNEPCCLLIIGVRVNSVGFSIIQLTFIHFINSLSNFVYYLRLIIHQPPRNKKSFDQYIWNYSYHVLDF